MGISSFLKIRITEREHHVIIGKDFMTDQYCSIGNYPLEEARKIVAVLEDIIF